MRKPAYVVFSDLDGTLLDHVTYSYDASLEGLDILKKRGIPLVLVSSKTFPEITDIHRELGLDSPFVFENGGGVAYPRSKRGGYRIDLADITVEALREKLPLLEDLLGYAPITLLEMPEDDICALTGLSPEGALLSKERKSSIPFIPAPGRSTGPGEIEVINRKLADEGLVVVRGGRFYHFSGVHANKGRAVRRLVAYYGKKWRRGDIVTIGIGDSENDIPMLESVTQAVLVRRPDGSPIETGIAARVTSGIGPAGFSEAIRELFPAPPPG